MNIRDRIKAIDDEYSESEIYLEYGLPSLMLYEPTPYKNLIVDINIERDKYTARSHLRGNACLASCAWHQNGVG